MSAQPFTDPQIYEVNRSQVDMHYASRYLTFSDGDGLHQFYFDHHPGYVPVTIFLHNTFGLRALIAWSPPAPIFESNF